MKFAMTSVTRRGAAVGCAALIVLALAACGGDSDDTATPSAAASATSAGATAHPSGHSGGAAPSPSPSAAGGSPAAAALTPDSTAAVQTIIDLYVAVNAKDYAAAYGKWANGGAASGKSAAEFATGYADTLRVSLQAGQPTTKGDTITVPATIRSVVNGGTDSSNGQSVQEFNGTYSLQQEGGAWHITAATLEQQPAPTEPPSNARDAVTALQSFYDAVAARNFPLAYTLWSDNGRATGADFETFVAGYAQTTSVVATFGNPERMAAAGSAFATVPAVVVSTQDDGSHKAFCGTYSLRGSNLPPYDLLGWQVDKAAIVEQTTHPTEGDIQNWVANGCPN